MSAAAEAEEADAPPAKVMAKDKEGVPPESSSSGAAAGAVGGASEGEQEKIAAGGSSLKPQPAGGGEPRESERTKELLQRIQEVEEEKRQIEDGESSGRVDGWDEAVWACFEC